MNKKKTFFTILFILGLGVLVFFLSKLGKSALELITQNFNFHYLLIFIGVTLLACLPFVWRVQIILKAHNIKIPFITLLRQQIAGYSISYTTPFMRVGGEPLRAWMLNKECGVDYKTGSSCLIIDRYIEGIGTVLFGVVVLVFLLFLPINLYIKLILSVVVLFSCFLLFYFYYRTIKGRGSFSTLFVLFRLNKIRNWNKFTNVLIDVEKRMGDFFINHKKEFLLSFLFYLMSGTFFVLEFKYALLSFGIDANIIEILLAVTMMGIANLTPIPGGVGVLEGLQSGLFHLLKGDGSIGLALVLLLRVRSLFFIVLGYSLALRFGGLQFLREYKNKKMMESKIGGKDNYTKL